MENKYDNRINDLIDKTLSLSKTALLKTFKINSKYFMWFEKYINGVDDKEQQKLFNVSIERVKQLRASVIRNLIKKNNINFQESINVLNETIKRNFTNEKRFFSVWPEYSRLYKLLRLNSFILIDNVLVDPNYFNYIIKTIEDKPMNIENSFFAEISDKESFMRKYLGVKAFTNSGYLFYSKHIYLKWHFSNGDVIDVKNDFLNIPDQIRAKSIRAQAASLERYDYLIKVSQTSFMLKNPYAIKYYLNIMFTRIKETIYEKSIYKFVDIKHNVIKTEEEDILFPNDSLYYIVREFNENDFNFDKGNRKIIYPFMKKVQSLKEFLEFKYPEGMSKIDMQILKNEGFSETIHINTDLIYGYDLYISKNKMMKIKSNIKKYFSIKKVFFTITEIADNTIDEVVYIMNNYNMNIMIANWFDSIIYINGVFLKIDEEFNQEDKEKVVTLVGDYLVDRFANDDFISALDSNDNSQIGKFFKAKSHLTKNILKYIYTYRQITPTKKKMIRDFFDSLNSK